MKDRQIKFRVLWGSGFQYFDFDTEFSHTELEDIQSAQVYGRQFMQFTGLKDKNGVDIYEGDVVKAVVDKVSWVASVIFDEGAFSVDLDGYVPALYEIDPLEIEVVGNAHQHPELLEAT